MSSQIYTTKAIICGSKVNMTSDKAYLLFTEELGMLWATARSVRMEKSKQRCALQDFSIIRVSLIQGRSIWRIGSVEALSNPFLSAHNRLARESIYFVVKSLRRYVHGEGSVTRLFNDSAEALLFFNKNQNYEMTEIYKQIFLFRLLSELGYIKISDNLRSLVTEKTLQNVIPIYKKDMKYEIEQSIKNAQKVSHL